jgi:hypothetical protein
MMGIAAYHYNNVILKGGLLIHLASNYRNLHLLFSKKLEDLPLVVTGKMNWLPVLVPGWKLIGEIHGLSTQVK